VHEVHVVAAALLTVPALHAVHAVDDEAPVLAFCVPAAHDVRSPSPVQ